MNSYETSHNRRTSRTAPRERDRERSRTTGRRRQTDRRRSVGATAISASGARALGLSRRDTQRTYGRGETARRVEAARNEYDNERIQARPAVYTGDAKQTRKSSRFNLPSVRLPQFNAPHVNASSLFVPVVVLVALAIFIVMLAGPARTYYHAWRDAGRSKAEYEALVVQNQELNHEVERLQTLEGIEDAARTRGYVYPDEEALVVTGVEEEETPDTQAVTEALKEHESNQPWYVGYLDMLFGYEHD